MGEYLELAKRFKAVKFKYDKETHPDHIDDKRIYFGVIAQDLAKIFSPELYSIVSKDTKSDYLKVDYSQFNPLLIKALQEVIDIVELIPELLSKIDLLLERDEIDSKETIPENKDIEECACQCNYSCTCNCNYNCTCQCDYSCTCQCNYSCTCNCYYNCTCQCNNS